MFKRKSLSRMADKVVLSDIELEYAKIHTGKQKNKNAFRNKLNQKIKKRRKKGK